ncbi:hypothetical protein FRC07_002473 [Ceratobasidium sp. 392]|nr:hypothetical protein FRC07_002473 [Ceratobasidium sp. 392]
MTLFASKTTQPPANGYPGANKRSVTISQGSRIVQPLDELVDELVPSLPGVRFLNSLATELNFRVVSIQPETLDKDSATLSAYHGLNELSSAREIHDSLTKSWAESPDLTLRIIWNMRSIHEGQSNKIGFYRAFGWLYKHHPRTALKNLKFLVEGSCSRKIVHKLKIVFDNTQAGSSGTAPIQRQTEEIEIKLPHGCYKDLLNILVLALREELTDPSLEEFNTLNVPHDKYLKRSLGEFKAMKRAKARQNERFGVNKAKEIRNTASLEKDAARSTNAKKDRQAKYDSDLAALKYKLDNDHHFLALYATVAHLFADQLAKDIKLLKTIESAPAEEAFMLKFGLSNASKWAPTLEGFHDRATNISTAIALILFSRRLMPELPPEPSSEIGQEKAHTIRGYYRRWFLAPLRRFAEVTEVKMSDREWNDIGYDRVPSKCLLINMNNLWKQDTIRMKNHFQSHPAIDVTTLKPHELLVAALKLDFSVKQAIKALPPLQYEPPPPQFYFQTPFGRLKMTLAKASLLADQIGAELDERTHSIFFPTTTTQLVRVIVAQTGTPASAATATPLSGAVPLVGANAILANAPPKYVIECTEDGGKYIVCGDIRIEIQRPKPLPHQILTKEVNARNLNASWPVRKRELTAASKVVEEQRQSKGVFEASKYINNGLAPKTWDSPGEDNDEEDYESVFLKTLLPTAINNRTQASTLGGIHKDMVKRYFVFSDLNFGPSASKEVHTRIVRAFRREGYPNPDIVYWNLKDSNSVPADEDASGCAMVTGFSGNLLRLFAKDGNPKYWDRSGRTPVRWSPHDVMNMALQKPCYDMLEVYDLPIRAHQRQEAIRAPVAERGDGHRRGSGSGGRRGAGRGGAEMRAGVGREVRGRGEVHGFGDARGGGGRGGLRGRGEIRGGGSEIRGGRGYRGGRGSDLQNRGLGRGGRGRGAE